MMRGVLIAAGAELVVAPPSSAQPRDAVPVVVGVAGGVSLPHYTDLGIGVGALWLISARAAVGWPAHVELFYQEWRGSTTETLRNVALFGPQGVTGRADQVEMRYAQTDRAFGINVLIAFPVGPVLLSGGGRLQHVILRESHRVTLHGCASPDPSACKTRDSSSTEGVSSMQAMPAATFPSTSVAAGVRIPIW